MKVNDLLARRKRNFKISTNSIHKYNYRCQAELSILSWIETWYNKRSIHSTLGYKTINEIETEMYNQNVAS
ncbi:hypothetical protein GCM10023314_04910 [Algibacter agarivorans]|uniref:Integrase catalytic domain-containing protein n=1 Tax=Algibacter agarivorans TaxID=1109741 RepID=A0ABP9GAL5_9FLAO